jgi:RIO-like serine/threonine protein kinase
MARVRFNPDANVHQDGTVRTVLRHGRFGTLSGISVQVGDEIVARWVERDTRTARPGLGALARRLAARESQILALLEGVPGVPRLAAWDGRTLRRSWLEGSPLQTGQSLDRAYFREALRLVRRLHALGVVHNDLARSTGWLVTAEGRPALPDFRHAVRARYRGRRFRALARADLRDLLEHRRAHCREALTTRQRALLERRPSWLERAWLWAARKRGHS